MNDKGKAERVMVLRGELEKTASQVSRLEGLADAAADTEAAIVEELRALGFDPDGDLDAEIGRRVGAAEEVLAGIQSDVAAIRQEIGA